MTPDPEDLQRLQKYLWIWTADEGRDVVDPDRCLAKVFRDQGGFSRWRQCNNKVKVRVLGFGFCLAHARRLPLDLLPPDPAGPEVGGWRAGMKAYRAHRTWQDIIEVGEATVRKTGKKLLLEGGLAAWDYRNQVEPGSCSHSRGEALQAFMEKKAQEILALEEQIMKIRANIRVAGGLLTTIDKAPESE